MFLQHRHTQAYEKQTLPPTHTQTIMDTDYRDDMAILENTPIQVEYLRHSQDRVALVAMWLQTKQSTMV